MKKIAYLLSTILPTIFLLGSLSPVLADIQVEVSGNGEGTSNSVSLDSSQNTTVTQGNTANVTNDVSQEANSGGNTVSDTTGSEASITTGNVSENTQVSNNLNSSEVAVVCCSENAINIKVSGNGGNSVNTVNTQVAGNTTINVSQIANVNNNINLIGNTGENTISGTGAGNALIDTGNINAKGNLTNILNSAEVKVGKGAWDITIINKDNGDDSVNVIYLDFVNNLTLYKTHLADINNQIYADLNTGRNKILDALGDVTIKTGDIDFSFNVTNGPLNTSDDEVLCCDDGEIPEPPEDGHGGPPDGSPPPSTPTPAPTNGKDGDGKDNGGNNGEVLAAVTGILPITGASGLHFWILGVVYLLTFLSGLYLRLRAGRSPDRKSRFQGYLLLTY